MPGKYLRTNYRKTGGQADITEFGGGILLGSNSTTTPPAGGGFMYFSYAMTIAGDTIAAVADGWSFGWGDSTFGTMSLYYGSGVYSGGYRFWPVDWNIVSISDINLSGVQSLPYLKPIAVGTSGSVWRISFARVNPRGSVFQSASTCGCRALVWGLIVSAP